ncbi:hypothetical protein Acear_1365 [Acetohalobium arabaticum DSM 5501]|uniref:Uncharacterized protein n=1 Tax=Acetohalobium arabaticum (strain ATCC 49924 / DSM 5501 / Z-7288) TaxID=574087 RepID=D9QQT7_ACEAZ|nr:hypothetical protein Acear_1365 [Acetohalobium arabaticum DSM 5501]
MSLTLQTVLTILFIVVGFVILYILSKKELI